MSTKFFISLALFTMCGLGYANAAEQTVYGNNETVVLYPGDIKLAVKLDTGAENASLDAADITEVEKDGKTWVKFKVPVRSNGTVKLVPLELPLVRYAYIKARSNEQNDLNLKQFKRPVVEMQACMGNKKENISVNLTNRSHFKYSMIFGRKTIMVFNGVVDPKLKNTVKPNCEVKSNDQ